MKLEIIFQFTNETFHTQLQIRGNFKVCDCRNGTPRRAVVNRLEGQGSRRKGVQCDSTLHVGQPSCNRHLQCGPQPALPLYLLTTVLLLLLLPVYFLGFFATSGCFSLVRQTPEGNYKPK